MRHTQAQALHAACSPALHGRGEQTLLDTQVRDTGEIAPDALTLHWADGALQRLQADVARALGLPEVRARLHNLLVYGPGQFFKPHQDTEKYPGMVATLVLVWPSAHIGGTLRVVHGKQQGSLQSQHLQAGSLRWFAFYADCQHEVLPVQEGWRVVLSFDLVVPAQTQHGEAPAVPALVRALRAQCFPDGEPSTQPWVFLLDHEYTEHGLRWHLLKGLDRPRVAALRSAAQQLELVMHLALAEIHESWTATPRYRGRYDEDGDPEPDELIEDSMALDFWVDADGRVLKRQPLHVDVNAAQSFTDTGEDYLVNEEYEGYMGNYGETLDYWYRRAALVLHTPQAEQAARFVTDFDAALADALALARGGDQPALTERLQGGMAELVHQLQDDDARRLWPPYAELAAALPDGALALQLCEGFDWTRLQAADAPALVGVVQAHGSAWGAALLQAWAQDRHGGRWHQSEEQPPWPRQLPAFVQACESAGLPAALLDQLLAQCLELRIARDQVQKNHTPAQRHAVWCWRARHAAELAQALAHASDRKRCWALLAGHVHTHAGLYPTLQLRALLQALPAQAADLPDLQGLRAEVLQALCQALQTPQPPADDHRLPNIEWICRCQDCQSVIAWAEAPGGQGLTLAIAEARRSHVQERLQQADAPLRCETVKQGSPYKLVIKKPAGLHAQRSAQRRQWLEDWEALGGG